MDKESSSVSFILEVENMRMVKVVQDHTSESIPPLIAKKGDSIAGEKKETEWEGWLWCHNSVKVFGWVPEAYLIPSTEPGKYILQQDYTSKELSVKKGDELIEMVEESGWAWVRTPFGEEGWVPLRNLQDMSGQPNTIPDLGR
jgi:hypothetical protein